MRRFIDQRLLSGRYWDLLLLAGLALVFLSAWSSLDVTPIVFVVLLLGVAVAFGMGAWVFYAQGLIWRWLRSRGEENSRAKWLVLVPPLPVLVTGLVVLALNGAFDLTWPFMLVYLSGTAFMHDWRPDLDRFGGKAQPSV